MALRKTTFGSSKNSALRRKPFSLVFATFEGRRRIGYASDVKQSRMNVKCNVENIIKYMLQPSTK